VSRGSIKPFQPLECDEDTRRAARANCAARCRERGEETLALAYEGGSQDEGWAMRHEVNRLRAETTSVDHGLAA
jgi:hypothetical protein